MTTHNSASPWVILAAILSGTFVGTLGNSVANVALPAVMAEFNVPLSSDGGVLRPVTRIARGEQDNSYDDCGA